MAVQQHRNTSYPICTPWIRKDNKPKTTSRIEIELRVYIACYLSTAKTFPLFIRLVIKRSLKILNVAPSPSRLQASALSPRWANLQDLERCLMHPNYSSRRANVHPIVGCTKSYARYLCSSLIRRHPARMSMGTVNEVAAYLAPYRVLFGLVHISPKCEASIFFYPAGDRLREWDGRLLGGTKARPRWAFCTVSRRHWQGLDALLVPAVFVASSNVRNFAYVASFRLRLRFFLISLHITDKGLGISVGCESYNFSFDSRF